MTLQQLKYYCAVYECRNITKAARKNFVTQPAVTAAIREFNCGYPGIGKRICGTLN